MAQQIVNVTLDEKQLMELADEIRETLGLRIKELERQRDQVLDYVAKLECSNCDHVHNDGEGRCGAPIPGYGRPCGCTWGPGDITKDIRDLLAKEKP